MKERNQIIDGNTGLLLGLGVGVLGGIMLLVMMPGIPWNWRIEGEPATLHLVAQQSMAAAAWWMVLIGILSASVGAGSLYLIARTLIEAKRSADAAEKAVNKAHESIEETRAIGRAQVRAYLAMTRMRMQFEDGDFLTVRCRFENTGQSPARRPRLTAHGVLQARRNGRWMTLSSDTYKDFYPDLAVNGMAEDEFFLVLAADASTDEEWDNERIRVEIRGTLHYVDVFGEAHDDSFDFRLKKMEYANWTKEQEMRRAPYSKKRSLSRHV